MNKDIIINDDNKNDNNIDNNNINEVMATTTTTTTTTISPLLENKNNKKTNNNNSNNSNSNNNNNTMIDNVNVHRMRYLQYRPYAINCMASSNNNQNLLAIARNNATIEIQDVNNNKFYTIGIVYGPKNYSISALTWVKATTVVDNDSSSSSSSSKIDSKDNNILIVGTENGYISIVDYYKTNQFIGTISCNGGSVYCLHTFNNNNNNNFAVGCQDGTIRIYQVNSTNNEYKIQLITTLPTINAPVLSITTTTNNNNSSSMYAGVADGTIRRFEKQNTNNNNNNILLWKSSSYRMTVEQHGRTTPTKVWTLAAINNNNSSNNTNNENDNTDNNDEIIISGDSIGNVQIWDGITGTIIKSFQHNDNNADVVSVIVSHDQTKIFASGIDSRVMCIARNNNAITNNNNNNNKWILMNAKRPHTHDVKTLAIVKNSNNNEEILCSGGIDTKLCTYSVTDFMKQRPKVYLPLPSLHCPIIKSNNQKNNNNNNNKRWITMVRQDSINIYEIAKHDNNNNNNETLPIVIPEQDTLIGTVQVHGLIGNNIAYCTISPCNTYLAISDTYTILLFQLTSTTNNDKDNTIITPIRIPIKKLPKSNNTQISITTIQFITSQLLAVCMSNDRIYMVTISKVNDNIGKHDNASVSYSITIPKDDEEEGNDENTKINYYNKSLLPIHSIITSSSSAADDDDDDDVQWFATKRYDYYKQYTRIDIYYKNNNNNNNGKYKYYWSIPSGQRVTAMKFITNSKKNSSTGQEKEAQQLVVACINFGLYIFDIHNKQLSKWSEESGLLLYNNDCKKIIPYNLYQRTDYPIHIAVDQTNPNIILLGSFGGIVAIDINKKYPTICRTFPESHVRSRNNNNNNKRKRSDSVCDQATATTREDDNDEEKEEKTSCTLCLRYNSMLYMDFIGPKEMIVIEQPWLDIAATFPPALHRKLYGT